MLAGHAPTLCAQAMRAQPLERPTAEQMQSHAWLLNTPAVLAPFPVARPASAEASDEEEESAEEEASEEEEATGTDSEAGEEEAGAEAQAGAVMGAGALCMAQLEAALPPV